MGETLYRRPEILFRWGSLCFDTESPGGDFISVKERLCFGGDFISLHWRPNVPSPKRSAPD